MQVVQPNSWMSSWFIWLILVLSVVAASACLIIALYCFCFGARIVWAEQQEPPPAKDFREEALPKGAEAPPPPWWVLSTPLPLEVRPKVIYVEQSPVDPVAFGRSPAVLNRILVEQARESTETFRL